MAPAINRAVFLFPGHGAYAPAALAPLRDDTRIADVVREIDGVAAQQGVPAVASLLFGDESMTAEELLGHPSEQLQLATFATSMATYRYLVDRDIRPHVLVGHSFGELAAMVASGAFSIADGTRLVCARAQVLKEWEGSGRMAAISTSGTAAECLIGALEEPDLAVACYNAPRQTVLSGPVDPMDRLRRAADALGLFVTALHQPYAFHHPSMLRAVGTFHELTEGIRQRPMDIPVHSPVHGRRYRDDDDLRLLLARCLVLPVRFTDLIRDLHARALTAFVEVGALKALTRCAELTVPGITTMAPLLELRQGIPAPEPAAAERPPVPQPLSPEPVRAISSGNGVSAARADTNPVPPPEPFWSAVGVPPVTSRSGSGTVTGATAQGRAQVLGRLRGLYAETLEYPADLVTEDARLEAELGVDSLKQTALLTRAFEAFELSPPESVRVLEYPTLGHVADRVVQELEKQ